MMTDVMQATSYLAQRLDIDPERPGALGYSMGSFVLGLSSPRPPPARTAISAATT